MEETRARTALQVVVSEAGYPSPDNADCGKYLNANHLHSGSAWRNVGSEVAMYVCICHGISESRLKQAIREGADSFEQLQSRTGVATCCGSCESCARELLDERLDSLEPSHQAA
jgi:bacterioferritin-associated ferredoxin